MNDGVLSKAEAGPRVLVIEPNRSALQVLARRISEAGYRVIAAEAGSNSVAELHRAPVDLVLAELRMTPLSGVELIRLIRDDSVLRDTPVIIIAGRSDRNGVVEALEAGADDVTVKPFDFDILIARIGREIARARALRGLREDNAALDARVVSRALELGDLRDQLEQSEAERRRLEQRVGG